MQLMLVWSVKLEEFRKAIKLTFNRWVMAIECNDPQGFKNILRVNFVKVGSKPDVRNQKLKCF